MAEGRHQRRVCQGPGQTTDLLGRELAFVKTLLGQPDPLELPDQRFVGRFGLICLQCLAPATSYRAPLNQLGWTTELATSAVTDMLTANNDTLT